MASEEDSHDHQPEKGEQPEQHQPGRREPITPATRKRLQKCFDHASKQMAQENYDYASELFLQCVLGDPSKQEYVQSYIGNLQKKYKNNKKGSPLAIMKERGARSAVKKALSQSQWDEVIHHGLVVLRVNPWDVPTLTAMATASESAGYEACVLFYLKCALDANPKDPEVNLQLGKALGKRKMFDQAIAALHRVEQVRPEDEDVRRAIASLAVEKTITKIDDRDLKNAAGRGGPAAQQAQEELSAEERLKKKIFQQPGDVSGYLELVQVYLDGDRFKDAIELLTKACKLTNNDADVVEKLIDAQLRDLRHRLIETDKQVKETGGDEAKTEAKRLRKEIIQKELKLWKGRCERYPTNLNFKYELGVRYEENGEFSEAIKEYQIARNDPRRKGVCMLHLGQCFQYIKQYRLAMSHYASAIEDIPDREADAKKTALYRAGKLAFGLKDLEAAEKHLSVLAAMDFSYRDVSALLDKIANLRDDSGSGAEETSPSMGADE